MTLREAMTTTDQTDVGEQRPGLRGLGLGIGYDSGDEALRGFYVPALSRAISYDRSVGFFRASAISSAARGVSRFIAGGGTMRLLVGAELVEEDRSALIGATEIPAGLAARLASELLDADEIASRRLQVLAWLAREGRLHVKVAVPVDADGVPVPPEHARPYFHEKIGVLHDAFGDGVAFQGSVNESDTAWTHNFESFSVYKSWDGSAAYFDEWATKFDQRWAGNVPGFKIFDLPDPAVTTLLSFAPDEVPSPRDVEEGPEPAPPELVATFLAVAPRLVGAEALGEATSAVRPFPHQRKVVARLAGTYPRSWLVADEVGLGKTISAGLALRQLLLSGQVERALILAPAGVCRQWQDELFEKFGLWVPRLDGGKVRGAHPDDVRIVGPGANPYAEEALLLVSSHLARRATHRRLILAAPPLDLLVVDEAHHARRQGADPEKYRPSRLLELLDAIDEHAHARATWLLTATPMQVHPIELLDLLRHVGLSGRLAEYTNFQRFYKELGKPLDADVAWGLLANMLRVADLASHPQDAVEEALLSRIEGDLGPVQAERIRRFGEPDTDPAEVVEALGAPGRRELRIWLRQRGPVGRHVTRHSRQTLRHYRELGLLDEPVAERDVRAVTIRFTPEEQLLYDELDEVLDELMQRYGTRRHAGLVLTVYRRRLTSSWTAIASTLRRRLAREMLKLEPDLLDDVDDLDGEDAEADDGTAIDDIEAVPLTEADLRGLTSYLERLKSISDSKFEQLRSDVDAARGAGQAIIVFTAFTDTLDYLCGRLYPSYRSQLATYTGDGGRIGTDDGKWEEVSKTELVDALRSGRVSVMLATDAASEGLNLQAASRLVNFDLPWNPMRVEQRIGRVDRIGQPAPMVTVRNYVIPNTIEEQVYKALAQRIDLFAGLVGRLQPILGATEAAFGRIFRSPRSERAGASRAAIAALVAQVDDLERSGIDLDPDDDPMPDPDLPPPPVDLARLRTALVEDLDVFLDQPDRPATFAPERVSRDRQDWCALATYGHPRLETVLSQHGAKPYPGLLGPVAFAESGGLWSAWRADRTPPVPVRTLDDLVDLGEPAAAGTAIDEAERAAHDASADRRRRIQAAEQHGHEQRVTSMRRRFTALVREAVNAESTLHARIGAGFVEPRLIWLDLAGDQTSGWRNADSLRQHLGLDLASVVPRSPGVNDARSDTELAAVRVDAGHELVRLVNEWLAMTSSEATST